MFQADGDPSNNALRRICKTEYFSWLRMRQWKDLVSQLRQMCKELKFKVGDPLPASRPGLEIRQLPLNQQARIRCAARGMRTASTSRCSPDCCR